MQTDRKASTGVRAYGVRCRALPSRLALLLAVRSARRARRPARHGCGPRRRRRDVDRAGGVPARGDGLPCLRRRRAQSRPPRGVVLVDAPCFDRPVRLVWRKRTWRCVEPSCSIGVFTEQDEHVARLRALLTKRACWWAIRQLRREHASIRGIARQLGTTWNRVWTSIRPGHADLRARTRELFTDTAARPMPGAMSLFPDRPVTTGTNPNRPICTRVGWLLIGSLMRKAAVT